MQTPDHTNEGSGFMPLINKTLSVIGKFKDREYVKEFPNHYKAELRGHRMEPKQVNRPIPVAHLRSRAARRNDARRAHALHAWKKPESHVQGNEGMVIVIVPGIEYLTPEGRELANVGKAVGDA